MDVKQLSTIIGLIITISSVSIGGVLWAESRYAKEIEVVQSIKEINRKMLEQELRKLELKEQTQGLSPYEKARKAQILRELQNIG